MSPPVGGYPQVGHVPELAWAKTDVRDVAAKREQRIVGHGLPYPMCIEDAGVSDGPQFLLVKEGQSRLAKREIKGGQAAQSST